MPEHDFTNAHTQAKKLDACDPLRSVADQFHLPQELIYFDGNSLGCMPKAALHEITTATQQEWASDLITSWNKASWFDLPTKYGDLLAPIIGADSGEVVISDSTSINIYKALFAGLSLRPDRHVIVAQASSFPTDLYMVEGALASRAGLEMRLAGPDNIMDLIDNSCAVVLLNHVDFRSGAIFDVETITKHAQKSGAIVIWDLCHSAGIMPIDLNKNNVDLAVGCTYKYLNGGPGAPAFNFAAKRHLPTIQQPLSGWWGHANPFDFDESFSPDQGIRKFLCGTQPILSFRAMKAGLEVFAALSMGDIRTKSMALSTQFIELVEQTCPALKLVSPKDARQRGSQVSFEFSDAYAVIQALIEQGVIGDFRGPNRMRFGFSPLYNSFQDVARAVEILAGILHSGQWQQTRFQTRNPVT